MPANGTRRRGQCRSEAGRTPGDKSVGPSPVGTPSRTRSRWVRRVALASCSVEVAARDLDVGVVGVMHRLTFTAPLP